MNLLSGLEGKVALITGSSKGIGRAIRESLESEGVRTINISRTDGFDLIKNIDMHRARLLVDNCDILINNVGGMGTVREYYPVMYINYNTMVGLTDRFLSKPRTWGRVITISSIYGKERGHNPYFTAAKAAQIAYMKSLAGKYEGITFNTIAPGHIDVGKEFPDNPSIIGKPEDVANLITFLCSDLAKHINGACIVVDGGESHSL